MCVWRGVGVGRSVDLFVSWVWFVVFVFYFRGVVWGWGGRWGEFDRNVDRKKKLIYKSKRKFIKI